MLTRRLVAVLFALAPGAIAAAAEPEIDFREEMRRLVEHVAGAARAVDPGFVVVAEDGLDLLVKPGPDGEPAPARAYRKALDGVLVRGLACGPPPGSDTLAENVARRLDQARSALQQGLRVLVAGGNGDTRCRRLGFVPVATADGGTTVRKLRRPRGESAASIAAPASVRTAAAVRNSEAFGPEDAYVAAMRETNHDLLVVDPFHGREALGGRSVRALQFKNLGARRLLLARVDVGTAARWQYFWQPEWTAAPPPWLGPPLDRDPDRHVVRYWSSAWRHILADGERSFLAGISSLGYGRRSAHGARGLPGVRRKRRPGAAVEPENAVGVTAVAGTPAVTPPAAATA